MRLKRASALLALLLTWAGLAVAQETTGTIRGRIVDPQDRVVPGVTVTATGPQGSKTAVTDAEGRYNIPFLTPGTYTVKAQLTGFKSVEQKGAVVGLGSTVDVPLKLQVGGISETVNVVTAVTPIDTKTTTIGAVLDVDKLALIPVGRRVSDTLYLAAGVSSSGTLGRSNPSISGGSGLENQYVVDGANITNQGYGGLGSYSIIFGSLGNGTPYDFIKEIQVKTGGYEAEFGQATGGVVNVVTKSGTNLFRGSAFLYGQPQNLEDSWKQYQATNGSVSTIGSSVSDVGLEGGGKIVTDRLFFFGAIDPSWQSRVTNAPPGFPLASLGDVERKRRTVSYAAKGTVQLSSGHKIDASFFGDPSHGEVGPQRTSALLKVDTSGFSTLDYGGHQQAIRYDGVLNSGWLIEAAFARSLNTIGEIPSVNTWQITDQSVTPTKISGGIGTYEAGNRSLNRQYTIKSTNIFGGHQVKYGFEYDDVVYAQLNQRTGPTFLAPDGRQTATGASITVLPDVFFGKIYRVTRANFNSERTTLQNYANVFVQDSWRINNRLTFNPGVRYEQEKLAGTIITDFKLKNNWAPRLGATYDFTGDGRTKLYGSYGVYFARIPNDLAARALSADDGFTRGDYFDAGLTRAIPAGTVTQTPTGAPVTNHFILAGVGADTIDPNAKLSYTNEVIIGFDREVMLNTTFGIRYVYRNMPRILEDVAAYPMVAYELGVVPNGGNVDYILTNPSSATTVVNDPAVTRLCGCTVAFDDPVHKYQSVEFMLHHREARWSGTASYRYSRLRGNFEGFYRDDNTQSDPGISSLYDFPTNDPSYRAFYTPAAGDIRFLGDANGILPLDRPHQIKLYGQYLFNMGLNFGVNLNLSSGKPLTPMAANPNYDSEGEIPVAARGSGIQTIDGFFTRTPFESQLDLQASYSLRIGGMRRLTFLADVFNLFNQERVIGYDQNTELSASTPNPDFGKPVNTLLSGTPAQFQSPRNVRAGVRFEF